MLAHAELFREEPHGPTGILEVWGCRVGRDGWPIALGSVSCGETATASNQAIPNRLRLPMDCSRVVRLYAPQAASLEKVRYAEIGAVVVWSEGYGTITWQLDTPGPSDYEVLVCYPAAMEDWQLADRRSAVTQGASLTDGGLPNRRPPPTRHGGLWVGKERTVKTLLRFSRFSVPHGRHRSLLSAATCGSLTSPCGVIRRKAGRRTYWTGFTFTAENPCFQSNSSGMDSLLRQYLRQ